MKQFLKDYFTEMGKLGMALIDMVVYGMQAGLFLFVAFYTFVVLYGLMK